MARSVKVAFFTDSSKMMYQNAADLICVPGIIHKLQIEKYVYKQIEVTGMPKLDSLFRREWDRESILRKFGLDTKQKTILFAPTFNKEYSLIPYIGFDLRKWIPNDYNIIIKLHAVAPEKWKRNYEDRAKIEKNVYYTEEDDITPCFAVADCLLTDISSVIYEFLPLHKQILLFDSPSRFMHKKYNENDLEHRFRDVGLRFSDVETLPSILAELVLVPNNQYQNIANLFISVQDGSSAERILRACLFHLQKRDPFITYIVPEFINQMNLPDRKIEIWANNQQPLMADNIYYCIKESNTYLVGFIEKGWRLSDLFTSMVYAWFMSNEQIGIVVPMLWCYPSTEQSIFSQIKQTLPQDPVLVSHLVAYNEAGNATEIHRPLPFVFVTRMDLLSEYVQGHQGAFILDEYVKYIKGLDYQVILAKNLLAYPV